MRRVVQLILFLLFVYLISATKWPPSDTVLVDAFLAIDPLISFQAIIASRGWVSTAFYGLLMVGLTLVLGRFFCGWMCPLGTCIEFCDDITYGKNKKRILKNRKPVLRGIKYALLLVILFAAIFGQGLAYVADPICWITRFFTYAFWPFIVAVEILFLDLFRPLFESLGWMNIARVHIHQPPFGSFGVIAVFFMVIVLWLNRYQRRFWCRVLCPLGAFYGLFARFSLFQRVVNSNCDDDGICARRCETGAIGDRFRQYNPGECIQCGRCVKVCKTEAVDFLPRIKNQGRAPSFDLTRRQTLAALGTGLVGTTWLVLDPKHQTIGDSALRPPGAVPEMEFLSTCVRCGQCIKACPTNCLQPAALETTIAGFMSPISIMRLGPCDQNCNACGECCPTDAIRSLDIDEKLYAKIGNAVINRGKCIVWEQDQHCLVCDEHCPYGAIYWKEDQAGKRHPYVDENRCNGCGQCEKACPIYGTSAIRITPAGEIRLKNGSYKKVATDRGLNLELKEDEVYNF